MAEAKKEADLSTVTVMPSLITWDTQKGQSVVKIHNKCGRQIALKMECSNSNYTWLPTFSLLEPKQTEMVVIKRTGGDFLTNECLRIEMAVASPTMLDPEKHFKNPATKIRKVNVMMVRKAVPATSVMPECTKTPAKPNAAPVAAAKPANPAPVASAAPAASKVPEAPKTAAPVAKKDVVPEVSPSNDYSLTKFIVLPDPAATASTAKK